MRARPLITENRVARLTAGDDIRVSLGRAVTEMAGTPMTGALISRAFQQGQAATTALTEDQREQFAQAERDRRNLQAAIEYDLDTTTDPVQREELLSKLDGLYQESQGQKDALFQQSIDEGRMAEPEDLNDMYDGIVTFTERTSIEEARLIAEGKKEEMMRNAIISRSPTGFVPSVAKFGGGMLAMATDPVEVATIFIPFVCPAGRPRSIARFGR